MNNKIKIVLVIITFAGGWILGSNNNIAPVITSSMGGASYAGGYQANQQQAEGAVALRTEQGQIHVVNDGDSIQAAVERLSPEIPFRLCPVPTQRQCI